MTFGETMILALELYRADMPFVLKKKDGTVLHGQEGWSLVIEDADLNDWNRSDWPQILEGARQGWLKNKPKSGAR